MATKSDPTQTATLASIALVVLAVLALYGYNAEQTAKAEPATTPTPSLGFPVRVGAVCLDGWQSSSTGSGTCSYHGGVARWLTQGPSSPLPPAARPLPTVTGFEKFSADHYLWYAIGALAAGAVLIDALNDIKAANERGPPGGSG